MWGNDEFSPDITAGMIAPTNSGKADSAEKDLMICLQFLIWFWMTALARGLTFPEDMPIAHGRRIPGKVRLMVSITRRRRELLRLIKLVQKIKFRESPLTIRKKYSHYLKNTSFFNLNGRAFS